MLKNALFPGKYIQGAGALGELPGLVKLFGRQGLILASPTATRWRWASCGSTGRRRTPGRSGCAVGVIQWYYVLTECDFYTVLFGVGRALGTLANIIRDRAPGYPPERPKSVTTEMLEKWAAEGGRQMP